MKKQTGFTLLESLLILIISTGLLLLPTLSIDQVTDSIQIDLFFRELTSKITMMHNHTLLHNERTSVQFSPSNELIRFRVAGDSTHPLNSEISLAGKPYTLERIDYHAFSFKTVTGNISSSDTVTFNTTEGKYRFTYLLGSGRFYVQKTSNE